MEQADLTMDEITALKDEVKRLGNKAYKKPYEKTQEEFYKKIINGEIKPIGRSRDYWPDRKDKNPKQQVIFGGKNTLANDFFSTFSDKFLFEHGYSRFINLDHFVHESTQKNSFKLYASGSGAFGTYSEANKDGHFGSLSSSRTPDYFTITKENGGWNVRTSESRVAIRSADPLGINSKPWVNTYFLPEELPFRGNFSDLATSLQTNANFEIKSAALGDEVSVFPGSTGKSGMGIRHIIEERTKKDNLSPDEITALSALVLDTVQSGKITRDSGSRCEFSKNGILAIVRKDFDDENQNWVLTGFAYNGDDQQKKREATETIQTVIARYGNTPEYSSFRSQVGAVIASLGKSVSHLQEKSSERQAQSEQKSDAEILRKPTTIEVNGKPRECKDGVMEGFKNAVRLVDKLIDVNHELADENERLRKQLNTRNKSKGIER